MPQAIIGSIVAGGAVSGAFGGGGIGIAGAIGIGATVVGTAAVVVGASYLAARLTRPDAPKPSDGQVEFRQPIPSRFFPYGRVKLSGPVLLLETDGGGGLYKIVGLGTREVDAFEFVYIDGTLTSLTGDSTGPQWDNNGSHGYANVHLGSDSQTVDPDLLTFVGWSSAHRLRGIPYIVAFLNSGDPADFQGAFPNGEPQFAALVRGAKVYDPRKDSTNGGSGSHRTNDPATWEFSDNQRLCTLDWLTWSDGYAKDWSRIDWATWGPQIDMADDAVPLKAGGTEPRYRVATVASLDEPRSRVLHRLLQAGDQQLFTTRDGLIGSRGGVWDAPTVTLDAAAGELAEGFFTAGVPRMDRFNEFQLTAMLPSHDYGEVDLDPWADAADLDHIAGRVRRQQLDLTMVPSNSQAQRLAKIAMSKSNPRWAGQLRTNFAGLDAIGEAVVSVNFDELDQPAGAFNGPFFVNGKIAFLPDKTGVTLGVSSAEASAYDWDAATEEQDAPPVPA